MTLRSLRNRLARAEAHMRETRVPNLKLVPKTPPSPAEKVRQRIKAMPRPASMLECRCGSREFIETKTGVEYYNGKPRGGTKQLLCLHCLMKGDRVVIA